MKKQYVAPESKFFALNISENIAGSDSVDSGSDTISSEVVIKFTHEQAVCREYYTGDTTAKVTVVGDAFAPYYEELMIFGEKNPLTYFKCFRRVGW